MAWDKRFDSPILLANGKKLDTLDDARTFILKLPKTEQQADEWQNATRCLLMVAEQGPSMFARMAITKALSRHEPPKAFDPSKKDSKWRNSKKAR